MLQIFFSLQITNNQQKKKVSMKNSSRKKGKTIVTYWVQYMYWFELRHINRTMNEKNEKKKKKSLRHLFSFGSYFFFSARRPFFVVSHFFFPIEANFCREQKKNHQKKRYKHPRRVKKKKLICSLFLLILNWHVRT